MFVIMYNRSSFFFGGPFALRADTQLRKGANKFIELWVGFLSHRFTHTVPPLPLIPQLPAMEAQTGAPEIRGDTVSSHAEEGGRWMEPVGATGVLHAPHRGELLQCSSTQQQGAMDTRRFLSKTKRNAPPRRARRRSPFPPSLSQGLPAI